ncbi:MAG: hypothetical protein ANABAC_2173 [Anaerolineae bacterium]|nr:MAG: hypothetical protein ANABAC_2173 [Anaerolineae bacterium]
MKSTFMENTTCRPFLAGKRPARQPHRDFTENGFYSSRVT